MKKKIWEYSQIDMNVFVPHAFKTCKCKYCNKVYRLIIFKIILPKYNKN